MKEDIRSNPQNYRGNVKLLTSQVGIERFNADKEIKRLERKIASIK